MEPNIFTYLQLLKSVCIKVHQIKTGIGFEVSGHIQHVEISHMENLV